MAVRQGLLAKSFGLAAEAYRDVTGGHMSTDSVRRMTEGWGVRMEEKRQTEAQQVYAEVAPQPVSQVVTVNKPIGSGTVESGINTVVHHRMKRQGRGWKRHNPQAMLAALSEFHSRRFQTAWLVSP